MDRLNAYSKRSPDGGVTVDIKGMMIDLIGVLKMGGYPEEMAMEMFKEIWAEVQVSIDIPDKAKN